MVLQNGTPCAGRTQPGVMTGVAGIAASIKAGGFSLFSGTWLE
jgi:hypothetical protein